MAVKVTVLMPVFLTTLNSWILLISRNDWTKVSNVLNIKSEKYFYYNILVHNPLTAFGLSI